MTVSYDPTLNLSGDLVSEHETEKKPSFCDHQRLNRWWTLTLCVLARKSGCPGCPVHPTLALMMVGLGSKMPCIFLKAGMTKRLQVTTADTGFPRTDGRDGRVESEERKEREKYMSNISSGTAEWITLSLNFTHYLGGQRLVCEHRPCPRWQMLLGDWKRKTTNADFDFNHYNKSRTNTNCFMKLRFKYTSDISTDYLVDFNPLYINFLPST